MPQLVSSHGIPKRCPNKKCKSKKLVVKVIDYSMIWHDGKVVCAECGRYIRDYDAG